MTEFIHQTLPGILGQTPVFALALVFLGGVLTSIGPCNLSMVPVIIGYVGGQGELTRSRGFWLSGFFTIGSSITFVALGLIAAFIGVVTGTQADVLRWLAAGVCIVIGLVMLGVVRLNTDILTRFTPKRVTRTGLLGSVLLGMIIGLTGSQCGIPVLVAILSIVTLKGQLAYGALLLFAYALGRGVPIVLAGTFTGVIKALPKMERWTHWMQSAAGLVLIGIGLYFVYDAV